MTKIILGRDVHNGNEVGFDSDHLARHLHLVGSTGSGKSTALLKIIRQILTTTYEIACLFIIDPMGNLSYDLLRWMANRRYCPEGVRRRLLYIEAAREDVVLPFNPLLFESPAHEYFQVERTISLILRAWDSQELSAMPRLRKWTFNAFLAAARLKLPISICEYLLQPGSAEHDALLRILPAGVKYEWHEILNARGSEAIRILESTRNRLDPYFRSIILKRMFGSRKNYFDVERYIRERRIVIFNVASYRRIPTQLAGAIGGLALNEILQTAMSMDREIVRPLYIVLDEFQNYINGDIYDAIPTVRQQGIRLILSHQSFSQLIQGDIDLTGLIWQPRNRLAFACDALDADTLAHELASLTYDPMTIKHQQMSHRQRIIGYHRETLHTWSSSDAQGRSHGTSRGENRSENESLTQPGDRRKDPSRGTGKGAGNTRGESEGTSETHTSSTGSHEVNVPIHEEVEEPAGVTFKSFDEERNEWGKVLRTLNTGEALAKFYNDSVLHRVLIDEDPIPDSMRLRAAVDELIQKNFESDLFVSAAQADREAEEIRLSLFQPQKLILPPGVLPRLDTVDQPSTAETDPSGLE